MMRFQTFLCTTFQNMFHSKIYKEPEKQQMGCQSYPRPHTEFQDTFSAYQEPRVAGVKEVSLGFQGGRMTCDMTKRSDHNECRMNLVTQERRMSRTKNVEAKWFQVQSEDCQEMKCQL